MCPRKFNPVSVICPLKTVRGIPARTSRLEFRAEKISVPIYGLIKRFVRRAGFLPFLSARAFFTGLSITVNFFSPSSE